MLRIFPRIFPIAESLFTVSLFRFDNIHRCFSRFVRIGIYLFIFVMSAIFGRCNATKFIIITRFIQNQCRMLRPKILTKMRKLFPLFRCFLFTHTTTSSVFSPLKRQKGPMKQKHAFSTHRSFIFIYVSAVPPILDDDSGDI